MYASAKQDSGRGEHIISGGDIDGRIGLAQAPSLLWSVPVNGRVFAVDSQTNVYASSGGNVILISGSGVPVQTNAICPLPGRAQRDSIGTIISRETSTDARFRWDWLITPSLYHKALSRARSIKFIARAVAFVIWSSVGRPPLSCATRTFARARFDWGRIGGPTL